MIANSASYFRALGCGFRDLNDTRKCMVCSCDSDREVRRGWSKHNESDVSVITRGVGYRSFVERHASALAIDGFVRNRRDGGVEVVLSGDRAAISTIIEHCRSGPRGARIDMLKVFDDNAIVVAGFVVAPTV